MLPVGLRKRFEQSFIWTPDCWPWKEAVSAGYGTLSYDGLAFRAHRLAMELESGEELPEDAYVMHRCDFPRCVRPAHLVVGDSAANIADARDKKHLFGNIHGRNSEFQDYLLRCHRLNELKIRTLRYLFDNNLASEHELMAWFSLPKRVCGGVARGRLVLHRENGRSFIAEKIAAGQR